MTTSISSLLQALRIVPTAGEQKTKATMKVQKELALISLKEVSNHDDYSDVWIVIYDRVYDVTKFLEDHPGGSDVIMDYAGRDATLAFHGTGHSRDAIDQMRDYLIGELPECERIFRTTNGGQVLKLDVPE